MARVDLDRPTVEGLVGIEIVGRPEMLPGLGDPLRLPVEKTEAILGNVESGIEPDRLLELANRLLTLPGLEVDPPENIVHLGHWVEGQRPLEVGEGLLHSLLPRR